MSNPWSLSHAEERVLLKLTQVHRREPVARLLGVALCTVESHLRNAKSKMKATSTMEAVLVYDRWRRAYLQESSHGHTDTRFLEPDRPAAGLRTEAEAGTVHAG